MQIPQQSPEDEQRQASQPLYEFVTDNPLPAATPGEEQDSAEPAPSSGEQQASPGTTAAQQADAQTTLADSTSPPPSAEAIRQGLVYPPPPSFYQNAPEDRLEAPVPSIPPATPGSASFPPPEGSPAFPGPQPGTEYIPPPAFVAFPPPGIRPPVRQSRKWMWIVIAMLGGVLLLSCGLCSWAGFVLFTPIVQDQANASSLVNNYYAAIQSRNYTEAYSYLAPKGTSSGLTSAQFIQQAQNRDTQYGPLRSYVPGQPSLSPDTDSGNTTSLDPSRLTITVDVTRPRLNYTVLLTLEKVNHTWKIVGLDGI
jgi:hypothetical protein